MLSQCKEFQEESRQIKAKSLKLMLSTLIVFSGTRRSPEDQDKKKPDELITFHRPSHASEVYDNKDYT